MSSDNMDDLDGWTAVACHASDDIRAVARSITSSLTDLHGQYGLPIIYTEWAFSDGIPVLRDYRYPDSDKPCAHYERAGWDGETNAVLPLGAQA